VNKPFTHNVSLGGYYVLSHGFQSVNEQAVGQATAQDFANLWKSAVRWTLTSVTESLSETLAHRLLSWQSLSCEQVLNGWTISPIVTLRSGTPFTVVTGSNKNFDSANANRPNLIQE